MTKFEPGRATFAEIRPSDYWGNKTQQVHESWAAAEKRIVMAFLARVNQRAGAMGEATGFDSQGFVGGAIRDTLGEYGV